jgi:hypothetical protein
MCLQFAFLLLTRVTAWLRLSQREEAWKTAEILILRHQLAVLQRRQPRRPHLTWADRALLAVLPSVIPKAKRQSLRLLVTPDTVLRWHRDIARRGWAITQRTHSSADTSSDLPNLDSRGRPLDDLLVVLVGEQCQRHHQVDHDMRRELPAPPPRFLPGRRNRVIDRVAGHPRRENAQRHEVRQRLPGHDTSLRHDQRSCTEARAPAARTPKPGSTRQQAKRHWDMNRPEPAQPGHFQPVPAVRPLAWLARFRGSGGCLRCAVAERGARMGYIALSGAVPQAVPRLGCDGQASSRLAVMAAPAVPRGRSDGFLRRGDGRPTADQLPAA